MRSARHPDVTDYRAAADGGAPAPRCVRKCPGALRHSLPRRRSASSCAAMKLKQAQRDYALQPAGEDDIVITRSRHGGFRQLARWIHPTHPFQDGRSPDRHHRLRTRDCRAQRRRRQIWSLLLCRRRTCRARRRAAASTRIPSGDAADGVWRGEEVLRTRRSGRTLSPAVSLPDIRAAVRRVATARALTALRDLGGWRSSSITSRLIPQFLPLVFDQTPNE